MTVHVTRPAGLAFGRAAKALTLGQTLDGAVAFASGQRWHDTPSVLPLLQKAAVDVVDGDSLMLPGSIGNDAVAAVRPLSLFDRIVGFRPVPLNTSILATTAAAVAYMVGTGRPKPLSAFSLARITVAPFKVASIVVVTKETLLSATAAADLVLGQELARGLAAAHDVAFIDPHAGPSVDSPGSITFAAGTTLSSTGSALAAIDSDLRAMVAAFSANDRDGALARAVWIMSPNTATYLGTLRGTAGAAAFPNIGPRGGALLGMPVFTSSAAYASGSPGESFIVLLDPAQILVGDDGEIAIDRTTQADLEFVDNPAAGAAQLRTLWQNNLVAMRSERFVGWHRVTDAAVVLLENVTY